MELMDGAPSTLVLKNPDLLAQVFNHLRGLDLLAASTVCRAWNDASRFVSHLHVDASLLESHVLSSFLADLPFRFPLVQHLCLASSAGDALLVSPHTDLDFLHTFDSADIQSLELYSVPDVADNSYWFGLRNLVVWLGGHRATLRRLSLKAEPFPPPGRRYQHADDLAKRRQLVADPVVHRLAPAEAPERPRAGAPPSDDEGSSAGGGEEAEAGWEAFRRLSDGSDDGGRGGGRRAAGREAASAPAALETFECELPLGGAALVRLLDACPALTELAVALPAREFSERPLARPVAPPAPFLAPVRSLALRLTGHGPPDPLPGCRTLARGVAVGPSDLDAGRLAALLRRLPLLERLELTGLAPSALADACASGLRCPGVARLRCVVDHDIEEGDADDDEAAASDGEAPGEPARPPRPERGLWSSLAVARATEGLFSRGLPAAFPALRRLEWSERLVAGQAPADEERRHPPPAVLPPAAAYVASAADLAVAAAVAAATAGEGEAPLACAACKRCEPAPPLACFLCAAHYHPACLSWPPGAEERGPGDQWACGVCAREAADASGTHPPSWGGPPRWWRRSAAGEEGTAPPRVTALTLRALARGGLESASIVCALPYRVLPPPPAARSPSFSRAPYRVVIGPRCTASVYLSGADGEEAPPRAPPRAAGPALLVVDAGGCPGLRALDLARDGPLPAALVVGPAPLAPPLRSLSLRRCVPPRAALLSELPALPALRALRLPPLVGVEAPGPAAALPLPALEAFEEDAAPASSPAGAPLAPLQGALALAAPRLRSARLGRLHAGSTPAFFAACPALADVHAAAADGDDSGYLALSAALPPSVRRLRAALPAASSASHVHAAGAACCPAELELELPPSVRVLSAEGHALARLAARLPPDSALEALELRCPSLAEALLALAAPPPPPDAPRRLAPALSPPRPPPLQLYARCASLRVLCLPFIPASLAALASGCPSLEVLQAGGAGTAPACLREVEVHGRARTGFPRLRQLALGPLAAARVAVGGLPSLHSLDLDVACSELAIGGGLPSLAALRLAARRAVSVSLDLDVQPPAAGRAPPASNAGSSTPPSDSAGPCSPGGSSAGGGGPWEERRGAGGRAEAAPFEVRVDGRGLRTFAARCRGLPRLCVLSLEGEAAEAEPGGGADPEGGRHAASCSSGSGPAGAGEGQVEGSVRAGPGTLEVALPFLPADFRRCFLPSAAAGGPPPEGPAGIRVLSCREAPRAAGGPPCSLALRVACGLDLLTRLEIDAPGRHVRRLHVALPVLREAALRLASVEVGPARFDCPSLDSLSVALCAPPAPHGPAPPAPAPPAHASRHYAPPPPPPPPPDGPLWYEVRAAGLRRAALGRVDARLSVLNGVALHDLRQQYRLLRGTRRDAARGMLEIVSACQALLWKCPVLFAPCVETASAAPAPEPRRRSPGRKPSLAAGSERRGAGRAGPGGAGGEGGPCCIPLLELDAEGAAPAAAGAGGGRRAAQRWTRWQRSRPRAPSPSAAGGRTWATPPVPPAPGPPPRPRPQTTRTTTTARRGGAPPPAPAAGTRRGAAAGRGRRTGAPRPPTRTGAPWGAAWRRRRTRRRSRGRATGTRGSSSTAARGPARPAAPAEPESPHAATRAVRVGAALHDGRRQDDAQLDN